MTGKEDRGLCSQKVGLGRGGPCLGMRERDTPDQTVAPRLPDRGHLDMQGLEWGRSGVTSGTRCQSPRGPEVGKDPTGALSAALLGLPRLCLTPAEMKALNKIALPTSAPLGARQEGCP